MFISSLFVDINSLKLMVRELGSNVTYDLEKLTEVSPILHSKHLFITKFVSGNSEPRKGFQEELCKKNGWDVNFIHTPPLRKGSDPLRISVAAWINVKISSLMLKDIDPYNKYGTTVLSEVFILANDLGIIPMLELLRSYEIKTNLIYLKTDNFYPYRDLLDKVDNFIDVRELNIFSEDDNARTA